MRQRLLEATVECLVEHGWSGTSTTLVSQRAGVSRGAQLHHFPTKNDLVLAAVEHLSELRGQELREAAAQLPTGRRRTRAVLEMFADHFTGPVFTAALELWVAARTDEALHAAVVPLEQRVGREAHRIAVDALGVDESQPRVRELVQATLDLVRGLGLANTITDDAARRDRILDGLGAHPRRGAEPLTMTRPPRPGAGRPRGRGRRRSTRWSRRSTTAGWRTPTPAAGWDVATQVAHLAWTDEVAVVAATDKAAWDAVVLAGDRRPGGLRRRRGAGRRRRPQPAELLARWRAAAARAAGGAARLPGRPEDAVVRPADEPHLDGHRPVHGDLGARARRRRGARRRRPSRPTGSGTSRTSACAPATSPSACTALEPPAEEFRIELRRPVRRALGVGPGRRRAVGARLGVRLLPAGHPAPSPRRPRPGGDRPRRRTAGSTSRRPSPALRATGASRSSGVSRRVARGSATAAASTATGSPPCASCSRGGDLDVVTGDYLAELTMLILGKDQLKDPSLGYARTFVSQVADCLALALEKGVRIVANAGGLNPAGPGRRSSREVAAEQGLAPRIAWVDGDNLAPRADELGLDRGADRQRLPRRLRHRPRARGRRRHRRHRPGHRRLGRGRSGDLAVRLVTRSSTTSWPAPWSRATSSSAAPRPPAATSPASSTCRATPQPLGFPVAEIAADGSSVITKHDGTGGLVSVDTVTAQLMYEVQSTHYLGPDVTVDLTTIELDAGRRRPGARLRRPRARPAAAAEGVRQRARRLPQPDGVRAHRASTSRRRPPGCAPSSTAGSDGRVGDLVDGPPSRRRTPTTEEGASTPAALRGQGPRRRRSSASRSPPRRSSSRWRRTPASR